MSSIDEIRNMLSSGSSLNVDSGFNQSIDQADQVDDLLSFSQTLSYIDEPAFNDWCLTPIYRQSATDATLVWQIGFNGQELVIVHGHVLGVKQRKTRTIITNNSGRSLQQQAWLEAKNRYKKMYNKGYKPIQDDVPLALANPTAMLANAYTERKAGMRPKAISPKLDGVRCLANIHQGEVALRSRENRPWMWLEHIREQLSLLFFYLPVGVHLDSELYSHDMGFNELISAVRTTKTKHPRNKDVKCFIFDVIVPSEPNMPYEDRYNLLSRAILKYIEEGHPYTEFCLLECFEVGGEKEVFQWHDYFVSLGYEGAIVRKLAGANPTAKHLKDASYRSTRCSNILKVKKFTDEEGIVQSVIDGEGTEKDLAIFNVRDQRGNIIPIRPRGSFEQRKSWYEQPELCIGKKYTFRYFELTEYGVPRFPVGIAFRDYE